MDDFDLDSLIDFEMEVLHDADGVGGLEGGAEGWWNF